MNYKSHVQINEVSLLSRASCSFPDESIESAMFLHALKFYVPKTERFSITDLPAEWVKLMYSDVSEELKNFGGNFNQLKALLGQLADTNSVPYKSLLNYIKRNQYLTPTKEYETIDQHKAVIENFFEIKDFYRSYSRFDLTPDAHSLILIGGDWKYLIRNTLQALMLRPWIGRLDNLFTMNDYNVLTETLRTHGFIIHPEDDPISGMVTNQSEVIFSFEKKS